MQKHASWQAATQDTINDAIARAVRDWPDRVFLDIDGRSFTFAEVDAQANRLAHGLAALGVAGGDTVTTILDNSIDAILVWFAINKLGGISVPVNTAYKGEFLKHQLNDAGSRVVIAESDYAERVIDVSDGLTHAQALLHRGPAPGRVGEKLRLESLDNARTEHRHAPRKVRLVLSERRLPFELKIE